MDRFVAAEFFTVLFAAASSRTCYRYAVVNDNNTTVGQIASSKRQHFVL